MKDTQGRMRADHRDKDRSSGLIKDNSYMQEKKIDTLFLLIQGFGSGCCLCRIYSPGSGPDFTGLMNVRHKKNENKKTFKIF